MTATTLTTSVRAGRNTLSELYCLTVELNSGRPEEEPYDAHRDALEAAATWKPGSLVLTDCPVETIRWLIGELRVFGDPNTGWSEEYRWRFAPFNRMADKLESLLN